MKVLVTMDLAHENLVIAGNDAEALSVGDGGNLASVLVIAILGTQQKAHSAQVVYMT